ncbi:MAG: 50S ribosomal protein L6 [Thermodesulfovibrionales bacterium]|nr:50S ribosomal protein L6 [Thermodesulfovibrionales bacterium]
MSRIGKKPIDIPNGLDVVLDNNLIKLKSASGELQYVIPANIEVKIEDKKILVERKSDDKRDRALHGLARTLIANMAIGLTQGYQRVLEITGVGYKAQSKGDKLTFALGYSHPIEFSLPKGVSATVDDKQTTITLKSVDKQLLGQVASDIKRLRPPDAYKGKGIRYSGQRLKLKAGKTGKK